MVDLHVEQTDLYVEDLYALIDSTKNVLPDLTIICAGHVYGRPYGIDFDTSTIWIAGHRIPANAYVAAMFEALHVIREYRGIADEPVHSRRLRLVPPPRESDGDTCCAARRDDTGRSWHAIDRGQRTLARTADSKN